MIISNEEIAELTAEVPEGHRHLRVTISLRDGRQFTLQEASVANLVRAYITLKTHPSATRIRMEGRSLSQRKKGFAEWQLIEDEPE